MGTIRCVNLIALLRRRCLSRLSARAQPSFGERLPALIVPADIAGRGT